jgi:L-threonylcarbamoyladenylate synthase
MLDRHYAPKARVILFDRPDETPVQEALRAHPAGTGILHWRDGRFQGALVEQLPGDPAGYARSLYEALRRMDDRGASVILVERPPAGSAWEALHDRLQRAARP